ncbi:AzlC family ABC transporter permease [Oscillibacter sp. MSJ-2]|uniref:AzlC family ABC transporter permease n=1 Tax=Dysosmobacter acutus TaxID=2841504 RepID=A0ABS6FCE2_9FIRM|nr:AzlC family ABC transporter permease [Dysosmobacter acutus]MBU5627947.1 AzlC family ABC transporter permease [Dysosmobacter acutus]
MSGNSECYSLRARDNLEVFREGMRDGFPIGLGYFAVAFSLGIAARGAGLTPFQGFLASILCNASAGEYAGFALIGAGATYLEVAVMTFIANARYLLMSAAISQRVESGMSWPHRMLMAFDITDELFAISIARPGKLNPNYSYGSVVVASPLWAVGTALGCIAGSLMPPGLVSALSVALFGMFLAVIIPPARTNKVIAGLVGVCFLFSYAGARLPLVSEVSGGTRTIVLTVLLSAGAALLFPRKEEEA